MTPLDKDEFKKAYAGYLPHPSIQISYLIWIPCVILLIVAVFPIRWYGYYQLLRIWVFISSIYVGLHILNTKDDDNILLGLSFFIIAIFFNPLFPFNMQKELWIIIDIVCAYLFVVGGLNLAVERREYLSDLSQHDYPQKQPTNNNED